MPRVCMGAILVAAVLVVGCGKPPTVESEQATDPKEVSAICDRVKAAGGRAERDLNSTEWQFNVKLPEGPISDELCADLRRLPRIHDLSLHGDQMTDDTLKRVCELPAFDHLAVVDTSKITAAGFGHISKLTHLTSFHACRISLSEEAMAAVGRLAKLQYLTFTECHLPPSGLQKVNGLTGLEWLHVTDPDTLSGEGLKSLKSLPKLRDLELSGTKIDDDALAELRDCKTLTKLDLKGAPITGSGLDHLRELPHLEHLGLQRTKVSDDHLKRLLPFKKLSWLLLDETPISDVGLRHLKELKTLTQLYGTDSKMTLDGYRELKKALPECTINDRRWWIDLLDGPK